MVLTMAEGAIIMNKHRVIFSIGTGVRSFYEVFDGTENECREFIDDLPSENDEGWEDVASGTNPFQEACHIEENDHN